MANATPGYELKAYRHGEPTGALTISKDAAVALMAAGASMIG